MPDHKDEQQRCSIEENDNGELTNQPIATKTNCQEYKARRKKNNPERKRHGARNQDRSKHFCKWLLQKFPHIIIATESSKRPVDGTVKSSNQDTASALPFKECHILDVAGGKGELAARLCMCHRLNVIMVDPREANVSSCFETLVLPKLPNKHQIRFEQQKLENPNFCHDVVSQRFRQLVTTFEDYTLQQSLELQEAVMNATLLVGMHADGATEAIVDAALMYLKPFVVIPCCVFPRLFSERRVMEDGEMVPVRSHDQFCRYLVAKDPRFVLETLPFEGRNTAVWWDGKTNSHSSSDSSGDIQLDKL